MADLPLLFFPQPVEADTSNRGGGGASIHKPSASSQRTRLNKKFADIGSSFAGGSHSEQDVEPEQVIVFETIGDRVEGLAKAAEQVPGLEWLAELDLDDITPEHGFANQKDATKDLPVRLYAVMSNQKAMGELVALWDNWCANPQQRAERNFGPFKNLFINLRDVRHWGVEDRIRTTGLLEYLQERMTNQIADAIDLHLDTLGIGVLIEASHACMGCRGVGQPDSDMVTSALRGAMMKEPMARSEFLGLVGR